MPPDRARLVHVQRGPGLHGEDGRGQAGQRLVPRCPCAEQQIAAVLDEVGDRHPLAGGQTVGREVIDHQDVKSAQGDRRVGNVVWVQMHDPSREAAGMDCREIVERARLV